MMGARVANGKAQAALVAAFVICAGGGLMISPAAASGRAAGEVHLVPAVYVFGDSTVDVGNNQYLPGKSPLQLPYGIDFPQSRPTGRFSNGFNVADSISRLLGFKRSPPAYLSLTPETSRQIVRGYRGVNYASGGSGILDTTGNASTTIYAQTHSPPLQGDFYVINTQQTDVYQYENSYASPQDYSTGTGAVTPIQDRTTPEEKLVSRSKRIQKRTEAKERTKVKQEAKAFFEGIDTKFLPEGYDDPNLDERTKKKMIQMVRNRISAQNSRDRRKNRLQQLEEINEQLNKDINTLTQEKNGLIQQLNSLQNSNNLLFQENQSLKSHSVCSSCGRSGAESTTQNDEEAALFTSDDSGPEGFSGLASPTLSRFASSGKGFLGFFAFAAVVSCVVIMGVQTGGQTDFGGSSGYRLGSSGRMLEAINEIKDMELPTKYEFDYSKSLILQNMKPLKDHFDMNHDLAFKAFLQKSFLVSSVQAQGEPQDDLIITDYVKLEEPEYRNAIMDYNAYHSSNLRRDLPLITAKNLPILSSEINDPSKTSTLFCPSGMEFYDGEDNVAINMTEDGKLVTNGTSNLESAEYLQLLVPRSTLTRYNVKNNLSGFYGGVSFDNDKDDNSMLEIWCKVFMIRELSQPQAAY